MTTTSRALGVLKLFQEGRHRVRASDVIRVLKVSSATAYRYIADLEAAGLIERSSINEYVLGPAIVELDRVIRENDPLIAAAKDIMKTLSERTGGTSLLARLHGRKVVCVHEVRGRLAPQTVSYERGRAMPLFRGATSKIILANLDADSLRAVVRDESQHLRRAGLPTSLDALNAGLTRIREAQVYQTVGEVDAEARGLGVAIHQGRHLLGSLSLVVSERVAASETRRLADQVLRAALRIEGRLKAPGKAATR